MIISQRVDDNGLFIQTKTSSVTITKADLKAQYALTSGSAASRKASLITWVRNKISTELGSSSVNATSMIIDLDPVTGTFSEVTHRNS